MSFTFAHDLDNSTNDLKMYTDNMISMDPQGDIIFKKEGCTTDAVSLVKDEGLKDDGQIVEPMPQVDAGVVSGGVDYTAIHPATTSGNLVYTIPEDMTNVKSAIVIVNIYSGSYDNTYALYSNVTLNTINGLEVLGYESLYLDKNLENDPNVYGINSHITKQGAEFQMIYDITDKVSNLNSGDEVTINVDNFNYGSKEFDGRIKLISLLFAYDDGDNDNYTYWLHAGQLWTLSTASFDFDTKNYAGKTDNISLRKIVLTSKAAHTYKINNMESNYDSATTGVFNYKDIRWNNISSNFIKGMDTNFWFECSGAYKTSTVLLIASEIESLTEVYVDYYNGNDGNAGTDSSSAFKTIGRALSKVEENGIIYVSGTNYLDGVGVNGLDVNKNISIIGLGGNAIIDANNNCRIFNIGACTVNLSNLTLINANVVGASDKRGGALYVDGATLTVNNCKFTNDVAGSGSTDGRAIYLKSSTTTITNSVLLDGEKSVWVDGGTACLENNWWGNTNTNKNSNPKSLGYINVDVNSYLYLNIVMFASGMGVGDTASVNVMLVSTEGSEVDVCNLPVNLTAVNGVLNEYSIVIMDGLASSEYTITAAGSNSVTANVLGIQDTYTLSASDVISTEVIYLDSTGGSDSNSGVNWENAVQTIEKAIRIVDENGVIHVADGLYRLSDSTPTTGIAITKNVTIIGQSINSIISGNNAKRIFSIGKGNTLNIDKLTLTNAYITGSGQVYGGAILIEDEGNTNPISAGKLIISNSVISNSYAPYGGAIGTKYGSIDNVNNVTFINNSANSGGVLYIQGTGSIFKIGDNCKFVNNTANGRGSAIYSQSKVIIGKNNLFYGNDASGQYGYGAICSNGFELGTGNVFADNKAVKGGALYLAGNKYEGAASYCIFINNRDSNGCPVDKQTAKCQLTLDNCYWGTNTPDFSTLCKNGAITYNNYLILTITSDNNELHVGDNAVINIDLTKNQNGETVDIESLPNVVPLTFAVANGNVNPVKTELVNGEASTIYSPALMGEGSVTTNIYSLAETFNFDVLAEVGTVFVNYTGGLDTNAGDDWNTAVKTIKHALEIVGEGKTIYIADGINYLDDAGVDGVTVNKNVNIIGMGDNVVIDANNNGRIFNIGDFIVKLSNLIFINGNASSTSNKRGGALNVNGATLTIGNCEFINNTAGTGSSYGGAINLKSSTTSITESYFENNNAFYLGGAINAENNNVLLNISTSTFKNNLVSGSSGLGAAICSYNTVMIDKSIFYGNSFETSDKNGKSIYEYGSGRLTVTNSILLDGKKSVWVNSGTTTLKNNWWGNDESTRSINPKDLEYTNADVNSYLVLSSKIGQDKVYRGDLVTVTTTLENNVVELPVILGCNIGNIAPMADLVATSVSIYDATEIGDAVITIDVLGIKNEVKFSVKETLPRVSITDVKTQWKDGIYPAVNNTFTIILDNAENGNVGGLVLEVYSNESSELIASYNIDSLVSGNSQILVTDPTIRPITEQTVWPEAENNKIKFSFNLMRGEDVASSLSVDKILAYDGYFNKTYVYGGHDNIINRNYTISGDLIIATQDVSVYCDQFSRERTETWNVQTPQDAEIVKVFLYFNYNWDTSYYPNGWNLKFNEANLIGTEISYEKDRGNLGGWGAYNYGLLVFDVTDYYKVNEENSFIITKTGNCALYPSTLYVLYNVSGSNSVKDVYFSDICDVYYPNYNYFGYDDLLKTVVFYNDINVDNLVDATLYVFTGSSSAKDNLTFNNGVVVNPFNGHTANDCRPYVFNVTSFIETDNEAWFVTSVDSSTTVAYEQVLVVERNKGNTSINVVNDSVKLGIDDEFDIGATLIPSNVGELTYSSSNDAVATVVDGKIVAKKAGNAVINVSFAGNVNYLGSSTTVNVTVNKLDATITVSDSLSVDVDGTVDVGVSTDSDGVLSYSIADESVATVSDGGVVSGLKGGSTILNVSVAESDKFNAKSVEVVVTVNKLATNIYVVNKTIELNTSEVFDIGAVLTPNVGELSYNTSNSSVAIIDNGKIIAGSKGGAIVTISFAGNDKYLASKTIINVAVDMKATWIDVVSDDVSLSIGDTFDIGAVLSPDVGELSYVSSNETVAVVEDGRIVAMNAGSAVITVSFAGNDNYVASSANVDVVVNKVVTNISVVSDDVSLSIGDTFDIGAVLSPDVGELSYVSSNSSVAVVEDGRIVAMNAGSAVITVSFAGNDNYVASSASVDVTVNKKSVDMIVDVVVIDEYYPGIVTFNILSNVEGIYNIIIGDNNLEVSVVDGFGEGTFKEMNAGKYNAAVRFSGNEIFEEATIQNEFEILKQPVNFTVEFGQTNYLGRVNVLINGTSGNYTIKVNDDSLVIVVDANNAGLGVIEGLSVGSYNNVNVSYEGNDNIESAFKLFNFTVNPLNSSVKIDPVNESLKYMGSVNITYTENNGKSIICVKNNMGIVDFILTDGKIVLKQLIAGNYTVSATIVGNENISGSSDEITFNVERATPEFTSVASENNTVGGTVTITVNAPHDAEGRVSLSVDGRIVSSGENLNDGCAIFYVSDLEEGTHSYIVSYDGDENYMPAVDENSFDVTKTHDSDKREVNVTVPETSNDGIFSISLPEDATGYLLVDIDGMQYSVPVENGSASVILLGLAPGNYSVNLTYTGDDKYDSITKTANLTINSNSYNNVLTIPENTETDSITYSINLPDDAGGSLEVYVDGKKYNASLNNGFASVNVLNLSEGNHNVTVIYTGDGKYSKVLKSITLNVKVPVYKITKNKNISVTYSNSKYYRVRITKDGKSVGAGESVTITYNGKKTTVKTDSNGYAKLKLKTNIKVKTYIIKAKYKDVSVSNKVKIKHVIKAYNKKVKKHSGLNVKISLKKVNGKYLKYKKIKVKFRGKIYKIKTNKKGVAIWKIKKSMVKNLKVGKSYTYKITYGKDVLNKKITIKR
ncbi:DUF3344 domain-containing protein [Methanobrevibacter sp.]|uniref:DUF3344 domain-containing protein n=1 Tax=Methanobrevibacter sp. TaxID=66852 RepID=UPI003866AEED